MRLFTWYLFSFLCLSFYGGFVCPVVDSLSWSEFTVNLLYIIPPIYLARVIWGKTNLSPSKEDLERTKSLFAIEFVFILLIGVVLTIFNAAAYEFPLGSGFKVTTGTLAFGFFLGLDSALLAARRNLDRIKNLPQPIFKKTTLIKGFSYVAITTILLTTTMISLVVFKDLEWILNSQDLELKSTVASTLMEIIFIMLVFLLLIINLIITYARNLRILFKNQIEILENVIDGNLNQYVPVVD